MLARRRHVVTRGEFLDDLDVGGQARAREGPFEEIVAQHHAVGNAAVQGRLEGVDVVDALARIGALSEQVLIDVRHGRGVGIDTAVVGEDALEPRALGANRQRGRDARLQHAIAFDHAVPGRVEPRPVQRMGHLADQANDRVARQARIGIEGHDVAHISRQRPLGARHGDEGRARRTAQQMVEFVQLAAFALPADPGPLRLVPPAPAMKQKEPIGALFRRIAAIEARDPLDRGREQGRVLRHRFGGCVRPVREEGEMNRTGRIGEMVDLEALDQLFDRRLGRQQGGNGHDRPQMRRHALAQLKAGQQRGAETSGDQPVDHQEGGVDGGQQTRGGHPDQQRAMKPEQRQTEQRQQEYDAGRDGNGADITRQTGPHEPPPHGQPPGAEADRPFECPAAAADQMVARLASPRVSIVVDGAVRRDGESAPGDLRFVERRTTGNLLDGGAIEVTTGKIHVDEDAAGAQHVIDRTHLLEELRPIDVGDQPHARDDVANRDVGRALHLMLAPHQLVGACPLACQALLEPAHGRGGLGILVAQAMDELDGEAFGKAFPVIRLEGPGVCGVIFNAQQAIGDEIGLLALGAPVDDAAGRTTQVLDQDDAERDRDGPQLADGERLDRLVRAHEAGERLGIEATVAMGHEGPGQAKHPRIVGQRSFAEFGKLAIVTRGKVGADLADLLLHEMEVIEEPFGGGRHRPAGIDGRRNRTIGLQQHALVVAQTRDERLARGQRGMDGLAGRQALRVLLEPLDAEQFAADGVFVFPNGSGSRAPEGAPREQFQGCRPFRQRRAYNAKRRFARS